MATLAIKGHPKRGNEVIEILEMLGGRNLSLLFGDSALYYAIDREGIISTHCEEQVIQFYLEEFLEKFPYKVGDKVYCQPIPQIYNVCISEIISMKWINDSVVYYTSNGHEVYTCDLQPYKEEKTFPPYMDYDIKATKEQETMEEPNLGCIDFIKHPPITDEVEVILGDYEFVLKDGKTYFVKKKPKYPKTYEECCNVLGCDRNLILGTMPMKYQVLINFQKLLICRNAYWKIAGEEMGLGKDWDSRYGCGEWGYWIGYSVIENKIDLQDSRILVNHILVFPTEEMRDAFYENFKDLIKQCKELL